MITMERAWDVISGRINSFFNNRRMNRYIKAANIVKQKTDDYLRKNNIKFTSKIVDDSEWGWSKVSVDIIVDLDNYDEVFKLWDKLCEVGYEGISKEDLHGVMLHVEPNYVYIS